MGVCVCLWLLPLLLVARVPVALKLLTAAALIVTAQLHVKFPKSFWLHVSVCVCVRSFCQFYVNANVNVILSMFVCVWNVNALKLIRWWGGAVVFIGIWVSKWGRKNKREREKHVSSKRFFIAAVYGKHNPFEYSMAWTVLNISCGESEALW